MIKLLVLFVLFTTLNFKLLSQDIPQVDTLNIHSYELRSSNRDSSRIIAYDALALSRELKYERGIALAQLNLGIHYCNGDQLDSARTYLEKSYGYLLNSNDPHYLAIGAWYKAKFYQKSGNFESAFAYLKKAEDYFRERQNHLYIIYLLTEQGVYHEMQDNYSKALEYYLEAYGLRVKHGELDQAANEVSNIASIYTKMEMYNEALDYAKIALRRANKSGGIPIISVQLREIGEIFAKLEKHDSAFYYYERSYQLAIQSKRKSLQSSLLVSIAALHNKLGNNKKANDFLLKAKPLGNELSLLNIYLQLSENYKLQEMQDSCLFYIHKLYKLADRRGSKKHLHSASTLLMQIHKKEQSYDSALIYSEKVNMLSDSIYSENNAKRFIDLKVQLETLEKEKEIQELEILQYQSKMRNTLIFIGVLFLFLLAITAFWLYKIRQTKRRHLLEQNRKYLEIQLQKSKKKLSNHTLSMIHRNNVFGEVKQELKEIKLRGNGNADPGLQRISNALNLNKSLESDWNNFSQFFSELHNTFFEYLKKQSVGISNNELRLCALIKLKLTNKEIASILNIEHKSVKMAKYRLKKKLKIEEPHSLDDYISKIE